MRYETHGHTRIGGWSPTYISWKSMMQRCYYQFHKSYSVYGGKGITVCPRWKVFENFLSDMGIRPEGKTLDRTNGEKVYSKENCRWATPSEQARNRISNKIYSFRGKSMILDDWSRSLGIQRPTLWKRIWKYGWSVERAFSEPARLYRK